MKITMRWLVPMLLSAWACGACGASDPSAALDWRPGPITAPLGTQAEVAVPDGYVYLVPAETKKFMELNQNPSSDGEYLVAPKNLGWVALFRFEPVGYVKDDEHIDADALLKTITESQVTGNQERKDRGWSTLTIRGWRFEPRYDPATHLLEWAIVARDDATRQDIVNFNTRLLGRNGIMEVTLLSAPESLDASVRSLKGLLAAYRFTSGEKYSEFRAGDHVAAFGLAALVAGGAAAVAAKKGLFTVALAFLAGAGKFVVALGVGALAWLRSLFAKKTRRT